ncbi:putative ribosome-binding factor A, mitochondrial [Haliotis asinina]|uniref:putative ribosome-binding factor A, mitochondrial n=1 Tax=Haliotis asinina TaxID=109174 RepID=UPI00353198FB
MIRLSVTSRLTLVKNYNSICVLQFRESSKIKMVKQLKKFIDKSPKKKWHKNPVMTNSITTSRRVSDGQRRRAEQVSTVLYNYITSIIDSGELSPALADMAVDINRVKVTPDFSSVNIYWLSSGSERDDELEIELKKHESKLRSILISYHIVGTIPQVTFVQDKTASRYAEVEKLLTMADYGPDFVPSHMGSNIRTLHSAPKEPSDADVSDQLQKLSLDFSQSTNHGRHIIAVDEKTDGDLEGVRTLVEDKKDTKSDLNFRSDLYGLNHEEMMKRLLLKKHKTKHRSSERTLGIESESENTVKPVQAPDYEKFLRTKSLLKKKAKLTKSDYTVADYNRYETHDLGGSTARGGTTSDDYDTTDSDDDSTDDDTSDSEDGTTER